MTNNKITFDEVKNYVDAGINNAFFELQKKYHINSGDVAPDMWMTLEAQHKELVKTIQQILNAQK